MDYLKKQRENQRLIKSFEVGSTLIFISFFVLAAIRPAVITISGLLGEIKSKEILTKGMKTKITQVMMAQDTFSQIQEKYLLIESSLPNVPDYTQAVAQVLGSAQDTSSLIDSIIINTEEQKTQKSNKLTTNPQIGKFSISYSLYTDYQTGIRYISQMENLRRLGEIEDFSVSVEKNKSSKDADPNKLIFRFSLNTFFWNPKNEK